MKKPQFGFSLLAFLVSLLVILSYTHSYAAEQEVVSRQTSNFQTSQYSLTLPDRWTAEAYETAYTVIQASGKSAFANQKIEIAYLGFEINENDDFVEWYNKYYALSGGNPLSDRVRVVGSTEIQKDGAVYRVLHTMVANETGDSQAIMITDGRLVLSISAYTHDNTITEVMSKLAESVTFNEKRSTSIAEIYGVANEPLALAQVYDEVSKGGVPNADIVARDLEQSKLVPDLLPAVNSEEFLQQEKEYNERIKSESGMNSSGFNYSSERRVRGLALPLAGVVTSDRQPLPSDWWSPITSNVSVGCSSPSHTGRAAQAIDIAVSSGTSFGSAYNGIVIFAGWNNAGYGYLTRVASDNISVSDANLKYWHNYAHLSGFSVVSGSVFRGQVLGTSGNSGNSEGPHLHFHATLDVNKDDLTQYPVDLSPLVGFRPNLSYPVSGTCGQIVSFTSDPIIVEPVMFTQRYNNRTGHFWFCYSTLNHTTSCYMEGVPNNGQGWDPLVPSQSPELRYGNVYVQQAGTYYIWVCGNGGTLNDDSLHMGRNGSVISTATQISGYDQSAWVWRSIRMNNSRPMMYLSGNPDVVNVWMREDGMKIDRVLFTTDINYNPTGNIRCGGY